MHPLKEKTLKRHAIVSYCSANDIVLEAAMEDAAMRGCHILIEATANQVNQFGGYTGMQPKDFISFIQELAIKIGLDKELLILGGDHLGPLTWQTEPQALAMNNAEELVAAYVEAGFTKIHLDTSMRLADDPPDKPLSVHTIASRGAILAKSAINAWEKRRTVHPESQELVFIIGSEVPIPGGAKDSEDRIFITSHEDFAGTVSTYCKVFEAEGLKQIWDNIIGVVVQPGVEFSDNTVLQYDRTAASGLVQSLTDYPGLVFEGHSTDYQTLNSLTNMVQDGVCILKVGPELTFNLRKGLLSLALLEEELVAVHERSNFRYILDKVMCCEPGYWEEYYRGSVEENKQARMYSLSDRCRYYLGNRLVKETIEKMFANIDMTSIPPGMVHQYLSLVFEELLTSKKLTARELIKRYLRNGVIWKYQTAISR